MCLQALSHLSTDEKLTVFGGLWPNQLWQWLKDVANGCLELAWSMDFPLSVVTLRVVQWVHGWDFVNRVGLVIFIRQFRIFVVVTENMTEFRKYIV